jgi:hypothetical protein
MLANMIMLCAAVAAGEIAAKILWREPGLFSPRFSDVDHGGAERLAVLIRSNAIEPRSASMDNTETKERTTVAELTDAELDTVSGGLAPVEGPVVSTWKPRS